MNTNQRTRKLTQFSLLLAIELILGFTPLGMVMIPPVSITLLHIPVIICGILMGPYWGGLLGLVFGSISVFKATTAALTPIDMVFSPFLSGKPLASFVLSIVPRILVGVLAALLYKVFSKMLQKDVLHLGLTAIITTILHTLMVLCALVILFPELGLSFAIVFGAILSINGILEVVLAAVICTPICRALLKRNTVSSRQ